MIKMHKFRPPTPLWGVVDLQPLGAGGCGDVFVGRRSDNDARVVVKYLRDFKNTRALRFFKREIRILKRRIKGFVPLLAANLDAEPPYYVMPHFERGPLTAVAGSLSATHLKVFVHALATSLTALHAQRIAHGDLKPDNIFVNAEGAIGIGDPMGNGVGCTLGFTANRGGTPGYWAPEVARGATISAPGDVYSFGATLYHMITGERPTDGARLDVGKRGDALLPGVRGLILACCAAAPRERVTMREVTEVIAGETTVDAIYAKRRERAAAQKTFVDGLLAVAGCVAGIALIGAAVNAVEEA